MNKTHTAEIIEWTSSINGRPISAWYVRMNNKLFGQYMTLEAAIQSACDKLTSKMIELGQPLDAQIIREQITFSKA